MDTCAVHHDTASVGHCAHCGAFGCGDCLGHIGGRLICRACVESGRVSAAWVPPWERRSELGRARALNRTFFEVIVRPSERIARLDPDGGIEEPIRMIVGWLAIPLALVGIALAVVFAAAPPDSVDSPVLRVALAVGSVTVGPVAAIGSLVLWELFAGSVQHGILVLLGARRGLHASLRARLYASGALLPLRVVPCLNYLAIVAVPAWVGIALAGVHDLPRWRGIVAAYLPVVVVFGAVFGLGLLGSLAA